MEIKIPNDPTNANAQLNALEAQATTYENNQKIIRN
jgi:hypothetical protein